MVSKVSRTGSRHCTIFSCDLLLFGGKRNKGWKDCSPMVPESGGTGNEPGSIFSGTVLYEWTWG